MALRVVVRAAGPRVRFGSAAGDDHARRESRRQQSAGDEVLRSDVHRLKVGMTAWQILNADLTADN
jgi:hypothetical protein